MSDPTVQQPTEEQIAQAMLAMLHIPALLQQIAALTAAVNDLTARNVALEERLRAIEGELSRANQGFSALKADVRRALGNLPTGGGASAPAVSAPLAQPIPAAAPSVPVPTLPPPAPADLVAVTAEDTPAAAPAATPTPSGWDLFAAQFRAAANSVKKNKEG